MSPWILSTFPAMSIDLSPQNSVISSIFQAKDIGSEPPATNLILPVRQRWNFPVSGLTCEKKLQFSPVLNLQSEIDPKS